MIIEWGQWTSEWQTRGCVPDLPLTPFQSDHDHIFNHEFHIGIHYTFQCLSVILPDFIIVLWGRLIIESCALFCADRNWGSEMPWALNKFEPLESEDPWAWSLDIESSSPHLQTPPSQALSRSFSPVAEFPAVKGEGKSSFILWHISLVRWSLGLNVCSDHLPYLFLVYVSTPLLSISTTVILVKQTNDLHVHGLSVSKESDSNLSWSSWQPLEVGIV